MAWIFFYTLQAWLSGTVTFQSELIHALPAASDKVLQSRNQG
jgi:hypothetical protein